jgi:hypothetical protein
VPALCVVKALDVIEHIVFSEEKKLSIAALSQTLPERLTERCSSASGLPQRQIAIARASVGIKLAQSKEGFLVRATLRRAACRLHHPYRVK